MNRFPNLPRILLAAAWGVLGASSLQAQWITQSFALKAGWNAVYLHVDASHDTLDHLVGDDPANPILEIWAWQPRPSELQFVQSPQEPVDGGSQWLSWVRTAPSPSALQRLTGNTACLVRVGTNVSQYTWRLTGKPLAPAYAWTTTGLNFLGFPTVPANPPSFEDFLAGAPDLRQNAEIYQYVGGPLGPSNPRRVYALRTTPVNRGQAWWMRAGHVYNRYYGPFELVLADSAGVDFGEDLSATSFRLRNLTDNALTVTLRLKPSEAPPPGQPAIAAPPPLLLRGAMNPANLTYPAIPLPVDTPHTWTLPPRGEDGADLEVVLGLHRAAMTQNVGARLAGVLRFTDSLGHSEVDVAVAARRASRAGLWIGGAAVNLVHHFLKSYQRDANHRPVVSPEGRYVVDGVDTSPGAVPRTFPLRLIIHNPETGPAVLLQRVFHGLDADSHEVVSRGESALGTAFLDAARRHSAVHLPWTPDNTPWAFDGRLGADPTLTTTVVVAANDRASNPFLHAYHPDHDNLDASFQHVLPQGQESYRLQRVITLRVQPPAGDFSSLVTAGRQFAGDYSEVITLEGLKHSDGSFDTRQFEVGGSFLLHRISAVPTLTPAP